MPLPSPSTLSPFSTTYAEARQKFAGTAEKAGAQLWEITHPLTESGGTSLAIDVAWLGPRDASRVVLCLSGVHGAEGYAGSGAQIAWLASSPRLPEDVAVALLHGVNPWGFAHGLRGTEDNIDLNRNWLDHTQPYPENRLYTEIHPHLCPEFLTSASVDAMLDAGGQFVERHGQWALEDAISRGQYTHPDGYHFGGTSPAWSTRALMDFVSTHLSQAQHVAYVDFHSGPVGDGETIFLCFSPAGSAAHKRAAAWWGDNALRLETVEQQWGSPRPTRNGIVFWGLEQLLTGQADIAGAVVEFCSAPARTDPRHIMRIPMLERWLRFVGGLDAPQAPAFLDEIRENYAPRRDTWENKVAAAGVDVIARAVSGAADWSRND